VSTLHRSIPRLPVRLATACLIAAALGLGTERPADAQVTPAAGYTPPDDTPAIKLGVVIFADYTYQSEPTAKDAGGNDYSPSSFNVARAYVNVSGNISHVVAFRVTPDVVRATAPGTSVDGSLSYRLKYAYAQINLDDWLPKGTFVRFGMQQTPLIDSLEGIYRYRFQGTVFPEREGYMSSSDIGVTFRTAFPDNYGDIHVGFYNGEGYTRPEVNGQKAFMARVGFRPLPRHRLLRGWRLQGFWTRDNYMADAPRNRSAFDTTFEHAYLNMGYDYLVTTDKSTSALTGGVAAPTLDGKGWSFWATPKMPFANGASIEALVRYDHMKPGGAAGATAGASPNGLNERTIVGGAYWFPRQGGVSAALLFDAQYEKYSNWVAGTAGKSNTAKFFVHSLISF
jgi:hypothetical protein